MEIKLNENERIDDLEYNNLKIIQNTEGFCFGIDSILLSDFAKSLKKNAIVADLGTGTGIISILLSEKSNLKEIYGIEIQKDVAEMAKRSVQLNGLESKVKIENIDLKDIENNFGTCYFDAVVTNPPYKKIGTGIINENEKKIISRHELKCTLEDIICQSFKIMKDKGEFYMVHRPDRLADIIYLMRKYKIEPKELRIVYSNTVAKEAKLILIKGIKNAGVELKVLPALYIYDKEGRYTDEVLKIYNKK